MCACVYYNFMLNLFTTGGKINIAGCPTTVTLDRGLRFDSVVGHGCLAGRFQASPVRRFRSSPETIIFDFKIYRC